MSTAELIKLAPFAVALASLAATGLLGYANYALSRDRSRLDREQFAHAKAMVFWDKKVEAYSTIWSLVTDAVEEFRALADAATDPHDALRKWVVIKRVNANVPEDDEGFLDLGRRVEEDPGSWLPWMLSERKVQFDELAAGVKSRYFFLAPSERVPVDQIFNACHAIRQASSIEDFRTRYESGARDIESAYQDLNDRIDSAMYGNASSMPVR